MRLALEREAAYAADFPFVEYGLDLAVMAELEKGVKVEHLTRTNYDYDPHYVKKEWVNTFLTKLCSRRMDKVPIKLIGKGGASYLLQEMVIHKGKGAPRVSKNFKECARHYNTKSQCFLPPKVQARMKVGGIRFASLKVRWTGG